MALIIDIFTVCVCRFTIMRTVELILWKLLRVSCYAYCSFTITGFGTQGLGLADASQALKLPFRYKRYHF